MSGDMQDLRSEEDIYIYMYLFISLDVDQPVLAYFFCAIVRVSTSQ